MMLESYTFKPSELPQQYRIQIEDITKHVVKEKKDKYWRNYKFFSIDDQEAITVTCQEDKVKVIASIYHREFFGKDVYRLCNRFLYAPDFREVGGTKTREGIHINHPLIHQQIQFVKKLNPRFYFISRQIKPVKGKWLRYYFQKYNKDFKGDLVVSDKQYWVCSNKKNPYNCLQTIIYPKGMEIPLESI